MEKTEIKSNITYDKCVLCGEETPYPIFMPISFREFYVEGAGQLCEECYNEIYNKDDNG